MLQLIYGKYSVLTWSFYCSHDMSGNFRLLNELLSSSNPNMVITLIYLISCKKKLNKT